MMLKKLKCKVLFILLFVLALNAVPVHTVQAANIKKKTLTATIDKKNPFYTCKFKLSEKTRLNCSVKILSISGKAKEKKIYWGYYETDLGKGSLFYSINSSKLKKNKTLKSDEFTENQRAPRKGEVTFHLPEGIKQIKFKITISMIGGKKTIQSFKKTKTPDYYYSPIYY